MIILALDPGKTTGWAQLHVKTREFSAGQDQFQENCDRVWTLAEHYGEDLWLVSEAFIITVQTAKNTQAPWSLNLIGVYKYASLRFCGRELAQQTPAMGKSFGTDAKLKAMGWWQTGGLGHANDAGRHLITFMAQRKLLTADELTSLLG